MSKLVKIILGIAFAVFVIGFVWAIVVAVRKPDTVVNKPDDKKGGPVAQAPGSTPVNLTPAPAAPATAAPSQPAERSTTRRYSAPAQSTETATDASSATASAGDAWANAGIDQYGNAFAEAYAN